MCSLHWFLSSALLALSAIREKLLAVSSLSWAGLVFTATRAGLAGDGAVANTIFYLLNAVMFYHRDYEYFFVKIQQSTCLLLFLIQTY